MAFADLLRQRLYNQHVSRKPLKTPDAVVRELGAVQAQDYQAARWALAQRLEAPTAAGIDEAFARGTFLRTHTMRPTWHFVAAGDLRWILQLTSPRVNAACRSYYRRQGLDDRLFARSRAVIVELLAGGKALPRRALQSALETARILSAGDDTLRAGFLLLRAELDGLICSGPIAGRQFTYMLLDERVPPASPRTREEARAELAGRYFTSHGPAMLKDFSWWSGLTMAEARAGVGDAGGRLRCVEIDGQPYYQSARMRAAPSGSADAYLIPAYDETLVSYRDARAVFKPYTKQLMRDIGQVIAIDGRPVGTWRRRTGKDAMAVDATPFGTFGRRDRSAIGDVVERYGRFHNVPVTIRFGR